MRNMRRPLQLGPDVIQVRGIDRDGNSLSFVVFHATAAELARRLYDEHWRYASLSREDKVVGGVMLDVKTLHRTWWVETEKP